MRTDEKRLRRAALIVAIGALLTGCAVSGYDTDATRRHLVEAGISEKAADCVVLALGPRIGDERLDSHDEASSAERKAMRELLEACNARVAAH